ncbi:hypothetical protein BGX26_006646 [Mortierella sp. AD094]|nr:hypothetical protein BGX26_006646 [Mortierella sp. AD094]
MNSQMTPRNPQTRPLSTAMGWEFDVLTRRNPQTQPVREFDDLARQFVNSGNVAAFQFPADFYCPITNQIMTNPVSTSTGSVYEHDAIAAWLVSHDTNPEDNAYLPNKTLIPCIPVRRRIEAFKQAVMTLDPDAVARLLYPSQSIGIPSSTPYATSTYAPPTPPAKQYASEPASREISQLRVAPPAYSANASTSSFASQSTNPAPISSPGIAAFANRSKNPAPISSPGIAAFTVPVERDRCDAYQPVVTTVSYTPTSTNLKTESQAIAAVMSARTVSELNSVLGTYLAQKTMNISGRIGRNSTFGEYAYSRPEVCIYNHLMHKLEILSRDVLGKNYSRDLWSESINLFRRQLFSDLYNRNDMVQAFALGINGGYLQCPDFNEWTLGIKTFPRFTIGIGNRVRTRVPNWGADRSLLSQVHTVFLIDDSGSMLSPGHTSWNSRADYSYGYGNKNRWQQVRELLEGMATIVTQQDPQGVDILFLNNSSINQGIRSAQEVSRIFDRTRPGGATYTGRRVNDIMDGYMSTLRYDRSLKPLNLVVFTDGESSDEEMLHWAIEEHVTKIVQRGFVAHQLGIEFIQVGDDMDATRHLQKLEEEVSRHHMSFQRDVVGVTPTTRSPHS